MNDVQIEKQRIEGVSLTIKNGELNKAKQLIDTILKSHPDASESVELETAKWQIELIREQFTLTEDQLYTALVEAIINFSEDEMYVVASQGYLIYRVIEGEKRYHKSAIKTVCRAFCQRLRHHDIIDIEHVIDADSIMKRHLEDLRDGRIHHIAFILKASLRMLEKDVEEEQSLKVYLPIPRVASLSILAYTPMPPKIASLDAYQRTVCFDTPTQHEDYSVTYAYNMMASYQKRPLSSGLKLSEGDKLSYGQFLMEKSPHITFVEALKQLAEELTRTLELPLEKARAIYDWVTQNISYTFMPDYRLIDNLCRHALTYKSGDCGTQAVLMISLLRYAGVPSTFCSGRVINPLTRETGMHDWLAFYVAPYGWIRSDPSYGADAYRRGDVDRWDFYFENCDLYRMPANQAFQESFEHQEIWRKDPYDNQCGEAGFDRLPQRLSYETETCVLSIEEHTVQ